jgi:N-methylhydantoinase A
MSEVADSASETTRGAYFGIEFGLLQTPVLSRSSVPTHEVDGPMIVEDMDSTTVVPPTHKVKRDEAGNIFIRTERAS